MKRTIQSFEAQTPGRMREHHLERAVGDIACSEGVLLCSIVERIS